MVELDEAAIKKIQFCKHLYFLSEENLSSDNLIKVATGIHLLQDSVEIFLIAFANSVGIHFAPKDNFISYIKQIEGKLGVDLPNKNRLIQLNGFRVQSKHQGALPAPSECRPLLVSVRDVFDEICLTYFGVPFAGISLIELLEDGEAKQYLHLAEQNLIAGEYNSCLINCSKSLFILFLHRYNILRFKDYDPATDPGHVGGGLALLFGCNAPYHTRSKEFIEENVNEPFDYIQIDYAHLEGKIHEVGIGYNDFWNLKRLTPEVYRKDTESDWFIKNEFNIFDQDNVQEVSEYVLNKSIDIALKVHQHYAAMRSRPFRKYYITLAKEGVEVYSKADKESAVTGITPPGLLRLDCSHNTIGLNDSDTYWNVSHMEDGIYIFGYVHDDDIAHE